MEIKAPKPKSILREPVIDLRKNEFVGRWRYALSGKEWLIINLTNNYMDIPKMNIPKMKITKIDKEQFEIFCNGLFRGKPIKDYIQIQITKAVKDYKKESNQ